MTEKLRKRKDEEKENDMVETSLFLMLRPTVENYFLKY